MAAAPYAPEGAWTIREMAAQLAALRGAIADGARELDLSRITEFDSAGVQLLVSALRTPLPGGGQFVLRGASEPVRELLHRYGLHPLIAAEAA